MEVIDQPTTVAREEVFTDSVIAKDGTNIGYYQLGQGPGLVLLHGSMETAQSHLQLAHALADAFTVYLPDRRGRGLSGPYGKDYSVREDVEDVEAILAKTGAHNVFGVSAGGIIMLQAALTFPTIHRAAIYEPPLSLTRGAAAEILARYDREIASGDVAAALVTGMQGAQMGPPIFKLMPRWLLEALTKMMMSNQGKKAKNGDFSFQSLAPTLHYDFALVVEMSERLDTFRNVPAEVLLLSGSQSPAYLKNAVNSLEKILPHVQRVEFSGLGHGGSGNAERGGAPERVAQVMQEFFAS